MAKTHDELGSDFLGVPDQTDRAPAVEHPWQEHTDLEGADEIPEVEPSSVEQESAEGSHFGTIAAERLPGPPSIPPPVTATKGDADPWVGRMVAGRYRIERSLAAGGMGKVYVAMQLPLGRPVALKMVRTDVGGSREQFVRRFFLEASASAKLTHPNIVIVHDYGETGAGDVFMAMEYLDGRSLDSEIKQTAPMPPERALHIGIQIGRALREAHGKGIIHRDLKPQNVMLVSSGDETDFVKVLDFGLVKMFQPGDESNGTPDLTRAGVLLGSPNYMSPEQILGGSLDPRTDIYSFGVVLYKMLTGKNPYSRDESVDVIYKHVYHAVPTIAAAGVQVPEEVEAVVATCLAKSKEERFASCKELVLALKEARKAVLSGGAGKRKRKPKAEAEADPVAAPPVIVPAPPAAWVAESTPGPKVEETPAAVSGSSLEAPRPEAVPEPATAAPLPPEEVKVTFTSRARAVSRMRDLSGPLPSVYLKGRDGVPIGPVPVRDIEVLFCERILDEGTPISADGTSFGPISGLDRVYERLLNVRQAFQDGQDPWKEIAPDPSAGLPQPPLSVMVDCAVKERSGKLRFPRTDGDLRLHYLQGKIVEVDTNIAALSLPAFLIERKLLSAVVLKEKIPKLPRKSGEVADALMASGLLPPHQVLEQAVAWAKEVIGTAGTFEDGSATWEGGEIGAPQIPLGLDRFAVLCEATRAAVDRQTAESHLLPRWTTIVIPSSRDGVTLDDFKLAPKELRLLRSIDGTKTVQELIEAAKDKEQRETVARTLMFAMGIGLVVPGQDRMAQADRQQTAELRAFLDASAGKDPFTILGITADATDEAVRLKYKDMAKKYHTDNVRVGAAPELVEAMRNVFTMVQQAFEAVETKERRDRFKFMKQLGYDASHTEEEVVRRVIEAEVLFKKAKTFIKLSKYEEAIAAIKDAVERKPKDIEFRVHARYFEFLAAKAKGGDRVADANRAIADIMLLIKDTDEEIASAYLFLGKLQKAAGRDDQAVKAFKKVLKFDPKNHEAESEIRLANLRDDKKKGSKGILGSVGRLMGRAMSSEDSAQEDELEDVDGDDRRSSVAPRPGAKGRGTSTAGRQSMSPKERSGTTAGRTGSAGGRSVPPRGRG